MAELKNLAVQQGADLDTKYMKANVEDNGKSKPCWKLTVTFKETNGKFGPLHTYIGQLTIFSTKTVMIS